jgi:hypothetical protein
MKKDIEFPKVTGVSIAVVKRHVIDNEYEWLVFLLNQNDFQLENAMVCSKGYGILEGEKRASSTLRHGFPLIESQSATFIELMSPEVFQLANEYWISYFVDNQLFDKKFVFVPESIIDDYLVTVPILKEKGILHV